jgi:hypothetical protein
MGSAYLFVVGYLVAAIVLVIFSLRVRKVYLVDGTLVFRYIYVGCALLAASFPFYALPYLTFNHTYLTMLNFLADTLLFLGLFFVSSFPLHYWGSLWRVSALARWIRWTLFALIILALAVTVLQYVMGTRPLVELTPKRVFIDHAPLLYNILKVGLIVFGGVASGITNIYYGAEERSLRSYLLGLGIAVLSIAGAITVFSYKPNLATIADVLYGLGGVSLVAGLITPRHAAATPPAPAQPQPPDPQFDPYR